MTSPLKTISQAYRDSIDESVDHVMVGQDRTLICWDVDQLIELGLGITASYERLDGRWRDDIARNQIKFDGDAAMKVAKELRDINATLITNRTKVIELIDKLESQGVVENSTLFRGMTIVPFDERAVDVHFTDADFKALASVSSRLRDTVCDEDDDL